MLKSAGRASNYLDLLIIIASLLHHQQDLSLSAAPTAVEQNIICDSVNPPLQCLERFTMFDITAF